MDPTTTPTTITPPSSPPQNPHTPPDTTIDNDCSQHSQSMNTSCHNLDNLKSLVFKLAARMLPAHQSLIQRRFTDIFPDKLIVPDHPPYADMILTALWELKAEGGASEEAISEYIKKENHELPWAHATILNHHLGDLHMKGKITMKQDRFYLCPPSANKPIPTPTLCSSPMSSPYSSSPTSLYSSPSSSSTSFSCGLSYERPKTKRRRRRKNPMGRGGKTVRVRGRGKGRGRTAKMIQAGQDKEDEEEEEKETGFLVEDRPKVIVGQDVCGKRNEIVKNKRESVGVRRSGRRKYDVGNEESLPYEQAKDVTKEQGHKRKQYNVVWIGRGVRKIKDFERDLLEDKSDDEVTDIEDDATREKDVEMIGSDAEVVEQYEQKEVKSAINVIQTRPIKNQQSDIIEKQNDVSGEQVELQRPSKDETHKRFHVQGQQQSESMKLDQLQNQEVQTADGQDSVTMQREEQVIVAGVGTLNGDTVAEPIRPEERHKKCNNMEEDKQEVQTLVEQDVVTMQCEGHAIIAGAGNLNDDTVTKQIRPEERHEKGNKLEENQEVQSIVEQDVVMMQSEARAIVAGLGTVNDDTVTEQIQPEERYKKGNKLEEENQEDQSFVEQGVAMMQCEAQAMVSAVGNLNDDTVTEEIRLDEQHKKGNKLEEENHEVQTLVKQDVVMMQCEAQAIAAGVGNLNLNDDTVTEQIQPEERHKNGNKVKEEIIEQDVVVMQCEAQSIVAGVEKQHDDTVKEQIWPEEPRKGNKNEELIHPREQCTERNRDPLHSCGQHQLQNEEAESAEERTQQGKGTEGNQTEIVPVTGTEVQQNLEMHQSETQARQACVTQSESEEQQLASEKHSQPQDHCTEENKSQLHEQQQRNVIGQVQLQGEVKVAEDELQQEQPHNVEEKDNELVHDVSIGQQDFVVTQTESEVEGDSEEHKTSEVHWDQMGIQETLASDLRLQQEGLDNAVLQEESEQRLPLKKRLRSSYTKEETIPNTKSQLELVTSPVRRSQRNHKTVPEAVGKCEGPDHSKEQLQQSGHSRPSTRNSKTAEAENSSNSRRTRSSGL